MSEQLTEETRAVAARVIPEVYNEEWLREYMEQVKTLTKGYPVDHICSDCGKRQKVYVHVPNFSEINKTVIDLWNQAYGRPGTAEGEPGGIVLVVERHWPGGESGANGSHPGPVPPAADAGGVPPLEG